MDLRYRHSKPADINCEDEAQELEVMQDYVQGLMNQTGQKEMLDALLIMKNICNIRMAMDTDPKRIAWYKHTAETLQVVLLALATTEIAPNFKLENPELYFPQPNQFH